MTLQNIILIMSAIFLTGFLLPMLGRRNWLVQLSLASILIGSLITAVTAGGVWIGIIGFAAPITIWKSSWLIGSLVLPSGAGVDLPTLQWWVNIDTLSGFFGFIVSGFSSLVAIYSFKALQAPHYKKQQHHIASAFSIFVWSTLMVIFTADIFFLIGALEIMTLAFGYLTLYKHMLYNQTTDDDLANEIQRKNARLAPQVYMIVSHTSTALLLVPVLVLAVTADSFEFSAITAHASTLSPATASTVFLLSLAGLGVRAGLAPAHFWVPLVHPASPTTTHAFSLGAAIKVAVYLMLRFFFQFLQPIQWWGYVLLLVAVITALVNVWYALSSHDLKSALAYHSIENIGIITVGIAMAMIFMTSQLSNRQTLASLALVASLYHTLNHAVFKGLLYLATGAIDNLTGQIVTFNKLGGLINKYRLTATIFLIGAVAISGFPPLNGFVSEWLTLQSLLEGASSLPMNNFGIVLILISLVILVASFALTAICFYKIAGLTLLGHPKASEAEQAKWSPKDVSFSMGAVMVFLAFLCFVLGVIPDTVILLLSKISLVLEIGGGSTTDTSNVFQFGSIAGLSSLDIQTMLTILVILGILTLLLNTGRRVHRVQTPWNCGTPFDPHTMQPTSSSLSFLVRDLLSLKPGKSSRPLSEYLPAKFILSRSTSLPQIVVEQFRSHYNRFIHWLLNLSTNAGNALQNGDIRRYLGYIFLVNIIVLVLFLLFGE